ncbi:MAG: hypothetical protein JNN12_12715 [Bacteroidetes Order II. Incertae sedis bacterium]|nr:hypothetical protein [Bacteroidetes Order II. bacterium]
MRAILILLLLAGVGCERPKGTQAESGRSATTQETTTVPVTQMTNEKGVRNLVIERQNPVLPTGVQVSGKPVSVATWRDDAGEHVLVQSTRKENGKDDYRSAYLYGNHFLKSGASYTQQWKIQDFVRDCPVDITLEFASDSPKVEDLDGDGTAETMLLYSQACKGDVSPNDLKLLLHKGQTKYGIRGTQGLNIQGKLAEKPVMQIDPLLKKAPVALQNAALNWWKANEVLHF